MPYVENIKVGSGETWPIRDVEAHESLKTLQDNLDLANEEVEAINGALEVLQTGVAGKAPSDHNHDSVYAKFIATITTGSCDDINVPLSLRDIRTDNYELFDMFATGGTKSENYAYIITLFLSNTNADASRMQIAIGYTWGTIATRAYHNTTGWKPWNMMMGSILHPYFYGDTLPDPGTPGRIFFLTQ